MNRITLTGEAANGKSGALIVTGSGAVWYIQGLQSWPDTLAGKVVRAIGIPVEISHPESDLRDAQGAWRQGMSGTQQLLADASWELVTGD